MSDDSGKGLNTIIGKGSVIEGTVNIANSIRIEGTVRGKLQSTETLTVGREGVIEAEIKVKNAIISGKVVGNIIATGRVELESHASLHGDLVTSQLVINEGAFFQGNCEMGGNGTPRSKQS